MDVVTIVLGGGKGRRIGIPKVRLHMYGIPLPLLALNVPTRKIFVTRRDMVPFLPPDVTLVYDEGLGPAYAIKKALEFVVEDRVVIKPIDMPFLTRDLIEPHIGEGIVVFASDKIHRVASIRPKEEISIGSPRVRDMYIGKKYKVVRLRGCAGLNINTMDDLLFGLECFKERYGGVRTFTK